MFMKKVLWIFSQFLIEFVPFFDTNIDNSSGKGKNNINKILNSPYLSLN